MNDNSTIVIEITGTLGEGTSEKGNKKSSGVFGTFARLTNPMKLLESKLMNKFEEDENRSKALAQAASLRLATTVASKALSSAEAGIKRYASLNEDYMTSQLMSNVKDTIDRTKSGINTIASGASALSAFGPWGMAAGAIIGGATFLFDQHMEYQRRMSSYYQQLNASNFQTEFSSSRLGLINNGRGTEN